MVLETLLLERQLEHLDATYEVDLEVLLAATFALQKSDLGHELGSLHLPLLSLELEAVPLVLQKMQYARHSVVDIGALRLLLAALLLLLLAVVVRRRRRGRRRVGRRRRAVAAELDTVEN